MPATTPALQPGEPTDLELMRGIQEEDPEALSKLYDRYNGIIKALILRVVHNEAEADDLLQEIFMPRARQPIAPGSCKTRRPSRRPRRFLRAAKIRATPPPALTTPTSANRQS